MALCKRFSYTVKMPPRKSTGRPPGRPRNPNKPEQFSIRLSHAMKFGLELLMRHLELPSLSQTLEHVLGITLAQNRVAGRRLLAIAESATLSDAETGTALGPLHMQIPGQAELVLDWTKL